MAKLQSSISQSRCTSHPSSENNGSKRSKLQAHDALSRDNDPEQTYFLDIWQMRWRDVKETLHQEDDDGRCPILEPSLPLKGK